MGKTLKDAPKNSTRLQVVKRHDGSFDLFRNDELERGSVQERWLSEELCVRYGYCGDEYDAILSELEETGKATRFF